MCSACTSLNSNGSAIRPSRAAAAVLAGADEGDDRVDHVEGLEQALEDVGPVAGLVQAELRAPGDDLDLVLDVAVQRLHEVERARHPVDQGHHVDGEAGLQLRELEQVVEHDVGVGVALQRDHEAGAGLAGRVSSLTSAMPSRSPASTSSWMRPAMASQLTW